jgi:hypothetical protein
MEKKTKPSRRVKDCEFVLPFVDLEYFSLDFLTMSPPRVGVSRRAERNTQSSTRVPQNGSDEIPTVVDVDEIYTPEYELITFHMNDE